MIVENAIYTELISSKQMLISLYKLASALCVIAVIPVLTLFPVLVILPAGIMTHYESRSLYHVLCFFHSF